MKITKSTLKQIIKEEYNKLTKENLSEGKFAVYAGKRDAEKSLRPLKKRTFDNEQEAEAFKQELSQQDPYTGISFQAGKPWELTVAPYAEKIPSLVVKEPDPSEKEKVWWVKRYRANAEGPYTYDTAQRVKQGDDRILKGTEKEPPYGY